MLSLVPKPQESLYSVLSRAHLALGSFSPLDTLKRITGRRGYKPLSGLPTNLKTISAKLGHPREPAELIDSHTHYNLYRPFLPERRCRSIVEGMLDDGCIKSRMGLLKSHCGASEQLASCRLCSEYDVMHFGFAYWHIEHLVRGVTVCPTHNVALVITDASCAKYGYRDLTLPAYGMTDKAGFDVTAESVFASEQIARILFSKNMRYVGQNCYDSLLEAAGLLTACGNVRMRDLVLLVKKWIKPLSSIPPYFQLNRSLSVERNWVASLVAGREAMHHPVKHVVLWGALETSLEEVRCIVSNTMRQTELPLQVAARPALTRQVVTDALGEYGSVTKAAESLGCSTQTLLVKLDGWGIERPRRAKKIDSEMLMEVVRLTKSGLSTARVSKNTGLSVTSVNRIKRAYIP